MKYLFVLRPDRVAPENGLLSTTSKLIEITRDRAHADKSASEFHQSTITEILCDRRKSVPPNIYGEGTTIQRTPSVIPKNGIPHGFPVASMITSTLHDAEKGFDRVRAEVPELPDDFPVTNGIFTPCRHLSGFKGLAAQEQ